MAQSGTTAGSTATAQSPAAGRAPGNLGVPKRQCRGAIAWLMPWTGERERGRA